MEEIEEKVVDQASAARTMAELKAEIEILRGLEALALRGAAVRHRQEVGRAFEPLQNKTEMFDANNCRRKLIIFTEPGIR
jgi:hypothetical protein